MNDSPDSPPKPGRPGRLLFFAWLSFFAVFPAALGAGWALTLGQDAAGSGIGLALGMLGVGLLGGIGTSAFVSLATIRLLPDSLLGKLLASLPWIIWASFAYILLFTRTGDRFMESL